MIIKEKEMIIKEKEMIIKEKEMIIKEKEMIIKEKEMIIKEKEMIIKEKEMIIKEKEMIIKEKEMIIKEKEMIIKEKRDERSRYIVKIIIIIIMKSKVLFILRALQLLLHRTQLNMAIELEYFHFAKIKGSQRTVELREIFA